MKSGKPGHGRSPNGVRGSAPAGCGADIGWGLVFQGVRDFYHSKFIPAETNFYHFNTGSEELATFTGRLILTPKFRLRFARPDPHAMYMAALSRKGGARASRRAARVGRATRRGCAGACMRRLCASTSDPRILGYWASLLALPHALHSSAQTALLPF